MNIKLARSHVAGLDETGIELEVKGCELKGVH
jgi:hypothetical protein